MNGNRMSNKSKIVLVFSAVLLALFSGCAATSKNFQQDADIIRHQHLKYYAGLLKEYKDKKGTYPFTGRSSEIQSYVFIANDEQERYATNPPFQIERIPLKAFFEELYKGTGREIKEYYDPQNHPDYKPNFYMYVAIDTFYFFAVHVSRSYTYSKQINEHYYKIELSNNMNANSKVVSIDELLNNPDFINECSKKPQNEEFFKLREEKYLNHTKAN